MVKHIQTIRWQICDKSFHQLHTCDASSSRLYDASSSHLYDASSSRFYDASSSHLYDRSSLRLYDGSSSRLYDASSSRLYDTSSSRLYDHHLHAYVMHHLHAYRTPGLFKPAVLLPAMDFLFKGFAISKKYLLHSFLFTIALLFTAVITE